METVDLVIIGSGPAAYTAALYASRGGYVPVLYTGFGAEDMSEGGQLMTTTIVENYPGFPAGIQGPELMDLMKAQAAKFGTKLIKDQIASVDLSIYPYKVVPKYEKPILASCIIVATGARPRMLDIPGAGDNELWQKGISTCAKCDGPLPMFQNKPIAVVGGGDSAMEEATYLSRHGAIIYLIHRGSKFRASDIMAQKVYENPKVEIIWNHIVVEAIGSKVLEKIIIEDVNSGIRRELVVSGLFLAIGHIPNTAFLEGQLLLDQNGYAKVIDKPCHTNKKGVYVAGDIHDKKYRQVVTAASYGCIAALEAIEYLHHLVLNK